MRSGKLAVMLGAMAMTQGCGGGVAIQPDRSIFSLDNNYQRHGFVMPIEETFDRTVTVFKEAGYRLDVIDRATGQISGRRGAAGDKGSISDKDLKFYALVLPSPTGSEVGLKIVQVIRSRALGASQAEIIVSDRNMYQFTFRRIENVSPPPPRMPAPAPLPAYGSELDPVPGGSGQ